MNGGTFAWKIMVPPVPQRLVDVVEGANRRHKHVTSSAFSPSAASVQSVFVVILYVFVVFVVFVTLRLIRLEPSNNIEKS